METKNCIFLFLVTVLILHENALRACSSSPSPYFNSPSYIDPDYKPPRNTWDWHGRRWEFDKLLRQYVVLEFKEENPKDSLARVVSSQEEAESYASYLQGAEHFNAFNYTKALSVFTELKNNSNSHSWVKEASTYMIARCQLIISQDDWNGYDDPTGVIDQSTLQSADASFNQYLKAYPDGLYAKSARDMSRKIYFLSGKQLLLDQELKKIMWEFFPASSEFILGRTVDRNVIYEFRNHFEGEIDFAHDSPMILAYDWLGSQKPDSQDLALLETREKDFSAYPGLFQFLRALGLYKLERYQELLEKTPEIPNGKDTTIWLSTQLLRARSFEKLNDYASALTVFEQMHSVSPEEAIDLEIANIKLNSNERLSLFYDVSLISSVQSLQAFALLGLSDQELVDGLAVQQITGSKRQVLARELARRYLLSRRFKELAQMINTEQLPAFLPIKVAAQKLAATPEDITALMSMGEFLYDKYITPYTLFSDTGFSQWRNFGITDLEPKCEPCKKFDERKSTYTPPIWFFQSVVKIAKLTKKKSELEAKALHYIVMGGRTGYHHSRTTWGNKITDSTFLTDEEAFTRLHKLYKDSEWAKKTPYYYQ